jgi:hypothetical protein
MNKHTPGPWEIEKFVCYMDRSDAAHWRENGKPNAKVGDELWWVARSIGPVCASNNHWAGDYLALSLEDARLIAAAPDLLVVLKEMVEMWEDEPIYGADIACKAYAAIKKAEGTE